MDKEDISLSSLGALQATYSEMENAAADAPADHRPPQASPRASGPPWRRWQRLHQVVDRLMWWCHSPPQCLY